ncbi:MAG: GNAT family N-acetyltransferase [Hyphomonadaceae bacterium]|nr:GNAT family N-acetyltransferase [Hyphomonadaceae bacterium]
MPDTLPNISGLGSWPAAVTVKQAARQTLSIFDEDWWLDASAPGAWDRAQVEWGGVVVGDMAFHFKRRWGLNYIAMPHLTRTMSPRLYPPPAKAATRDMLNQTIVSELMQKLPKHDRFERSLEPGCASVQGFVHANLAVTHMYTFRSKASDGPETMLRDMHQEARRAINKAQRECSIEHSMDLDRFIGLHRQSYGKGTLVHYDVLKRIFSAAESRGQVEIVFARLNGATDCAAMILIWDDTAMYTWLLARDRVQNHVGATSLLTFEAMKSAHRIGRILDLDGYVTPAVGTFLAKFGLQPVVRPYVNGSSRVWQALRCATGIVKPSRKDRHFRVA